MSNRLLSLLILVIIFGGLYGVYHYFFVANVGAVSVVVTGVGSGAVTVEMESEFKQSYRQDCERICAFADMPPVSYHLLANSPGYVTVEKSFSVTRGEVAKIIVRMDPEVTLSPLESPTDEEATGSGVITPVEVNTKIITMESGPIETIDGEPIRIDGTIYSAKDTENPTIKLITTDRWVFTYSTEDRSMKQNPLYDDLLPLASGDLIALIRKTSKDKLSLLNLDENGNDYIVRINIEKRDRKVLLQTPENGKYLDYQNGKVILVDTEEKKYAIKNAE